MQAQRLVPFCYRINCTIRLVPKGGKKNKTFPVADKAVSGADRPNEPFYRGGKDVLIEDRQKERLLHLTGYAEAQRRLDMIAVFGLPEVSQTFFETPGQWDRVEVDDRAYYASYNPHPWVLSLSLNPESENPKAPAPFVVATMFAEEESK